MVFHWRSDARNAHAPPSVLRPTPNPPNCDVATPSLTPRAVLRRVWPQVTFQASNGTSTTSSTEWGFVYSPDYNKSYPERVHFRTRSGEELTSPEVLVLAAEAAVKNGRFDIAAEVTHRFFLDAGGTEDQFLCRIQSLPTM